MSERKTKSRAERVRERRKKQRYENVAEMPVYKPVEPLRPSRETSFIVPKKLKPKNRTYEYTAALPRPREVRRDRATPRTYWRRSS